jgi:hypothetical protein
VVVVKGGGPRFTYLFFYKRETKARALEFCSSSSLEQLPLGKGNYPLLLLLLATVNQMITISSFYIVKGGVYLIQPTGFIPKLTF